MFEKYPTFRFLIWMLASVILITCLALYHPAQLPVVLYKMTLVVLAVTLAYWLDRVMFPYARPHFLFDNANRLVDNDNVEGGRALRWLASIATLRRALIIIACVLGLTLGL